jgi:diguanylate cyclase (GGDEF)-like protein
MKPPLDPEQLLAINEQLVLGMLRIQNEVEATDKTLREIFRVASLDELTDLPNRRELRTRLQQTLDHAQQSGESFALLFLDLNDLKQINDAFGHEVGDAVLIEAARCLTECVRDHDTVARYGGDEFVILLTRCVSHAEALAVADDIIQRLRNPRLINEHQLFISMSIGISIYPQDGADARALIASADAAMYRVKRARLASAPSQDLQMSQMRAANSALVMAALDAQLSQQRAEATLQQEKFILAKVAHELRAPLAPLCLSTEMLSRVEQKALPRLHEVIARQIEHLTQLVDDLVDVTRVRSGKMHLRRTTVELSTVIRQAIDVCTPAMNARLQMLELHSPSSVLYVDGDPLRLTQVFTNLLGNACKFSLTTGVITLSLSAVDGWAQVEIADNGVGISPEALPTIFEPFVQDPHSRSVNSKGLGIGLTVVRELVEAHGGCVVAHSGGLGLGCAFTVRLPLAELSLLIGEA